MRTRTLFSLVTACGVTALGGCGSSQSQPYNPPVPPPSGTFSDATLNGSYVVAFSGADISGGYESFFAVAGTLTTNGAGAITSGTLDLIDPALGSTFGTGYTFSRLPVSGSYSVTADGRGSGTISMTVNGNPVTMGIDFALASASHGLISRFDSGGSGSGTLDATSGVSQSALAGSYAFGLDGADATVQNYLSAAGAVTLDANGNISSGSATSLNSAAGYALNLSGANSDGEADMISEFTASGSALSGIYDANNLGLLVLDASLGSNGVYSAAASGTGTARFPQLQTTANS